MCRVNWSDLGIDDPRPLQIHADKQMESERQVNDDEDENEQ